MREKKSVQTRQSSARGPLDAPRPRLERGKPTDVQSALSPSQDAAASLKSSTASESIIRVAILLVNSQELLSHSIAVALSLDPGISVVAIETDPESGLVRVLFSNADVVILDRPSLAAKIREDQPQIRLLALGTVAEQHLVLDCIRAGIDGCASMRTSPTALGDAIKRVYAGEAVYETRTLLELLHRPPASRVTTPRRTAGLAKRELEVLTATAMGLNTAEAADHLGISVNTLRTHLKNILVKLGARSKLEAVLIAIREGRIELP